MIDRGVLNLRALLGGGRKIIRHDCVPRSDYLSVVYTRDVGRPEMTLWNARSFDNGHGWGRAGPLSFDPVEFRDRSHCIGFGDLAVIGYQEADIAGRGQSRNFLTTDGFPCPLVFSTPTRISDDSMQINEYFLQQVVTPSNGSYAVYWSFIDLNAGDPYTTYFRRSIDGGATWSDYYDFTAMAVPSGFGTRGMDGPLSMAAEGEFIAALVPVALDPDWASSPIPWWFPGGGSLGLTATAVNRTEESLILQAWSEVRLPDGRLLSPLDMNDDLRFAPRETIVKRIKGDVPPDAPLGGPYTYFVKIGTFPDSVIVEGSFNFAIVPAD